MKILQPNFTKITDPLHECVMDMFISDTYMNQLAENNKEFTDEVARAVSTHVAKTTCIHRLSTWGDGCARTIK